METNPAITAWALNELPPEFQSDFEQEMGRDPRLFHEARSVRGFCHFLTGQLQDSEAALTDAQRAFISGVAAQPRPSLTLLRSVPAASPATVNTPREQVSWFRENRGLLLPLSAAAALVLGTFSYVVLNKDHAVPQMATATAPVVKKSQISSPAKPAPPVMTAAASADSVVLASAAPGRVRVAETTQGGASFVSLNAAWERQADRAMPSLQFPPRVTALPAALGADISTARHPQSASLAMARRGVMHESDRFADVQTPSQIAHTPPDFPAPAITVTFGNTIIMTGGATVSTSQINVQRTIITTQGVTINETAFSGGDPLLIVAQTGTANPVTETTVKAEEEKKEDVTPPAAVSSLEPGELADFDKLSAPVQSVIRRSLELTKKNLTYTFASHDPARGGMDCSGTVYHVLTGEGIKDTPRQSDEMCGWVMEKSALHRTENAASLEDEKFKALQPGDLLFWSGTYEATQRKLPITHVMIYLGKRAKDGKPVIFGASDGRSYEGQRRCGVSVFDFKLPKPGDKAAFYGYGSVPGLRPAPTSTQGETITK
jgi:cell wall-associated NlpC family hydrolase